MTHLNSNLTTVELQRLIKDVVAGSSSHYTFLDLPNSAYVSMHEVITNNDEEVIEFTKNMARYFSDIFGKTVVGFKYDDSEAGYSVFCSLFQAQAGIIRILWLNNKILSVLIGSKPPRIAAETVTSTRVRNSITIMSPVDTYSAYYFGFAPESIADLSLTEENKATLMALPNTSWFVSHDKTVTSPGFPEPHKSIAVSEGYLRHGSIEKFVGSNDIRFLIYPKADNNFFKIGGTWGSGIPELVSNMAGFDYNNLINTQLLTGDYNNTRSYSNTCFMSIRDLTPYFDSKTYITFSFNAISEFYKSKSLVENKDLITRKYSVLQEDEDKKYSNNPKYDIIESADKMIFYICKSDKLKATALQTRITKSLREDFINFINWLGYFQLAADIEPGNLGDYILPVKLEQAILANWAQPALNTLNILKGKLMDGASEQYKNLYMGKSLSTVTPYSTSSLFNIVFGIHTSPNSRYYTEYYDPSKMLRNTGKDLFSFNKKFSLDINLISVLCQFAKGTDPAHKYDYDNIVIPSAVALTSFLTTNFLISDKLEQSLEHISAREIMGYYHNTKNGYSLSDYQFNKIDDVKNGQLLKTCITLSSEALAIFGSVANLTSPTDILSWLELSKQHFIEVLPLQLTKKYGNKIADSNRISALLNAGIEYYTTILSAAEPYSNKLLSDDDSSDETGE
jgi:hypothetical protein